MRSYLFDEGSYLEVLNSFKFLSILFQIFEWVIFHFWQMLNTYSIHICGFLNFSKSFGEYNWMLWFLVKNWVHIFNIYSGTTIQIKVGIASETILGLVKLVRTCTECLRFMILSLRQYLVLLDDKNPNLPSFRFSLYGVLRRLHCQKKLEHHLLQIAVMVHVSAISIT